MKQFIYVDFLSYLSIFLWEAFNLYISILMAPHLVMGSALEYIQNIWILYQFEILAITEVAEWLRHIYFLIVRLKSNHWIPYSWNQKTALKWRRSLNEIAKLFKINEVYIILRLYEITYLSLKITIYVLIQPKFLLLGIIVLIYVKYLT